jgi:hypothetical protein
MQMTKTKKFKVFLLSVITGLTALTTGFFAYTAIRIFHAMHSKTYGSIYSLKQSGMIFVNGHNGLKLDYPSLSGGLSGASFYSFFAAAVLLAAGLIIFMYIYFYRQAYRSPG